MSDPKDRCTGTLHGSRPGPNSRGTLPRRIHGAPPRTTCLVFPFGADGLVEQETIYGDSATMLRQLDLLAES
jgi:hypothetical protein